MDELQSHNLKEIAARYAVNHTLLPGMNIGLGTGSTAAYAVTALAERISAENFPVGVLVATSAESERLARFHGMRVTRDLTAGMGWLDVTIDGADEVDSRLNVIKGGGGALLREKLVASRTRREVIIVDHGKVSDLLGTKHSLPIMIVPYAWETTAERVAAATGCVPILRRTHTDETFISDDGLYCLDLETGPIEDPEALEMRLNTIVGVVDNGIFVNLTQTLVVAMADGRVEVTERPIPLPLSR